MKNAHIELRKSCLLAAAIFFRGSFLVFTQNFVLFIRETRRNLFNLHANGVSAAWPVLPRPLFKSELSISG
jgi:hypothetical protein